jgi:DNA-directed RNA polymerase subunit RPC12/RpoP
MTIAPMYKICLRCKQRYPYNPSVGDFGLVCPYCGKTIASTVVSAVKRLLEIIFG